MILSGAMFPGVVVIYPLSDFGYVPVGIGIICQQVPGTWYSLFTGARDDSSSAHPRAALYRIIHQRVHAQEPCGIHARSPHLSS